MKGFPIKQAVPVVLKVENNIRYYKYKIDSAPWSITHLKNLLGDSDDYERLFYIIDGLWS